MRIRLGSRVIVRSTTVWGNGQKQAPGIVTCVHGMDERGQALVNATAFPDGSHHVVPVTSVRVFASVHAADDAVGPHGYAAWPAGHD